MTGAALERQYFRDLLYLLVAFSLIRPITDFVAVAHQLETETLVPPGETMCL